MTLTEKECDIIFQALVEYSAKVATAANVLSKCGCCPVENRRTVEALGALIGKLPMFDE
jgi:hypothetical protein